MANSRKIQAKDLTAGMFMRSGRTEHRIDKILPDTYQKNGKALTTFVFTRYEGDIQFAWFGHIHSDFVGHVKKNTWVTIYDQSMYLDSQQVFNMDCEVHNNVHCLLLNYGEHDTFHKPKLLTGKTLEELHTKQQKFITRHNLKPYNVIDFAAGTGSISDDYAWYFRTRKECYDFITEMHKFKNQQGFMEQKPWTLEMNKIYKSLTKNKIK